MRAVGIKLERIDRSKKRASKSRCSRRFEQGFCSKDGDVELVVMG